MIKNCLTIISIALFLWSILYYSYKTIKSENYTGFQYNTYYTAKVHDELFKTIYVTKDSIFIKDVMPNYNRIDEYKYEYTLTRDTIFPTMRRRSVDLTLEYGEININVQRDSTFFTSIFLNTKLLTFKLIEDEEFNSRAKN